MFKDFGSTLLLIVGIVALVLASKMIIKVSDPVTRKISPSLADTLKGI